MSRLYTRLFLWFCVANLLTLLISAVLIGRIARENYATIQPDWHEVARDAVELYGSGGTEAVNIWRRPLLRRGIRVALLDGTQNVLDEPLPEPIAQHLEQLLTEPEVTLHPRPDLTLVSLPMPLANGHKLRFVAVKEPPSMLRGHPYGPFPPRALFNMLIEVLVSLLVIGAVTWLIARGIGKPVAQLQAAARRIAAGDLSSRIGAPLTGAGDELGQLARDFDRMAHRVESLVERNRWLLRDVSHELRSPLARLQLALELGREASGDALQRTFDRANREIARLDQLIAEMLALARVEEGADGIVLEPVDLVALAQERLAESRMELDKAGLRAEVVATPPVVVQGYRLLLGRALDNLLSNAIKFSPRDSEIRIGLSQARGQAVLAVEDRGPGVPVEELPQLFSPFYRGSNGLRANGQGLGLAIVERIVQVHGGHCQAANRDGGGLSMRLLLPLAPGPAAQAPGNPSSGSAWEGML